MKVNMRALCATFGFVGFICAAGDGQAATNRQAPISLFNGVDEVVFACTTSTTFVNIPGMSRTFNQGAGAAEEVISMLQGSFSLSLNSPFDTAYVRLLIDNVVQGPGNQVPIMSTDGTSAVGFNWQSPPLAAGAHTARVQWRTDLGSQVCADTRSLIVLHR
jgi:hypothetical protein